MAKLHFMTEQDRDVINSLVRERRAQRQNASQRPYYPEDDSKAPDVYVARITSEVSALQDDDATIGTATGTGTGVIPGSGMADIYRTDIVWGENRLHSIIREQVVYNLSDGVIKVGAWVLISRDKWGVWYITGTGTGGMTEENLGGHLVVTSSTTLEGRYPARKKIETGFDHSEWPDGDSMWTWNLSSSVPLVVGQIYPYTRMNTDKFAGLRQAAVYTCCDDVDPDCCEMPSPVCMTFASDSDELDGLEVDSNLFSQYLEFTAFGRQYRWAITCSGETYSVTQSNLSCTVSLPCLSFWGATTSVEVPRVWTFHWSGNGYDQTEDIVYGNRADIGYPDLWISALGLDCTGAVGRSAVAFFGGCAPSISAAYWAQGPCSWTFDQQGPWDTFAGTPTSVDPPLITITGFQWVPGDQFCAGSLCILPTTLTISAPWIVIDGVPTSEYQCPDLTIDSIVVDCTDDVFTATITGHVSGGPDDGDTFTATIAQGNCGGDSSGGCANIDCDPGTAPRVIEGSFVPQSMSCASVDTTLFVQSEGHGQVFYIANGYLPGMGGTPVASFLMSLGCSSGVWEVDIFIGGNTFSGTVNVVGNQLFISVSNVTFSGCSWDFIAIAEGC